VDVVQKHIKEIHREVEKIVEEVVEIPKIEYSLVRLVPLSRVTKRRRDMLKPINLLKFVIY